jgi:hypothetical protein
VYTEWGQKYGKVYKVGFLLADTSGCRALLLGTILTSHTRARLIFLIDLALAQYFSGAQPVVVINDAEMAR